MSSSKDLNDYKLETKFESEPKCVIHKYYKVDRSRGFRKAEVFEKWTAQGEVLGGGTFGTVRLETRLSGDNVSDRSERAVKQMYKWQMSRLEVDFRKELLALTKFSRSKVGLQFPLHMAIDSDTK